MTRINNINYEEKMVYRVWYTAVDGTETDYIRNAFFETKEAAELFAQAIGERKISVNQYRWSAMIEE